MSSEQVLVLLLIGVTLALFVWERIRYDIVALLSLLSAVGLGLVPPGDAFTGFADPAVITVAAVLVISRALQNSGLVDRALRPFARWTGDATGQVVVLSALVALFSAFMNNVGALALFLPAAVALCRRHSVPAAAVLMPMAFASLLGGLTTLIGTPPNILISAIRDHTLGEHYGMFDFAPVGVPLALAGIAILGVIWRLLPRDRRSGADLEPFRIDDYITEVTLDEESPAVGNTVGELETRIEGTFRVLAILRKDGRRVVPTRAWVLRASETLQVEAEPKALERAVADLHVRLAASQSLPEAEGRPKSEIGVIEAIVAPDSPLVGRTAADLGLRERFAVNLLATSRRGSRPQTHLAGLELHGGDVLMLQGRLTAMPEQLSSLGLLPLASRDLRIGETPMVWLPIIAMALAVAATSLDLVPPSIAFMGAVALLLVGGALRPDEAYGAVAWPVIVLLGALIPVSNALQTTGTTELLAGLLTALTSGLAPWLALALVMLVTMLVTPILNNAATVLVMAPIAASYAKGLGLAVDPFLMAVAVGASSDFLTPIGHQSNMLVMGPGGYRFLDYPRLGLPLCLLVLVAGTALIAFVWPLRP